MRHPVGRLDPVSIRNDPLRLQFRIIGRSPLHDFVQCQVRDAEVAGMLLRVCVDPEGRPLLLRVVLLTVAETASSKAVVAVFH
jgi:hypothetical protein